MSPSAEATPGGSTSPDKTAFDYYLLSLTWAPEFCATPANAAANPQECATGKHITFSVHGLWPEAAGGQGPESCGRAKTVPPTIVNSVLPYMYSPSLVQHEWAAHGTCTGLSQQAYFTNVIEARAAVQIPVQLTSLEAVTTESRAQIESEFSGANTSLPAGSILAVCRNNYLSEMRVCFDKSLQGRACAPSAGECTDSSIQIRPPR